MGFSTRRNLVYLVISFIILGGINLGFRAYSQSQNKARPVPNQANPFARPKPTKPIRPEVPVVNRYQQDKVFLEYADSLYKVFNRDSIERQILKGAVKFRQGGMWMYCDSAYYYPETNSMDAFSHVKMEQGDTLFVYADKLFYNGSTRIAKLRNGPTEPKVKLINRNVTLTTDSLNYDLATDYGWYLRWGTIDDKTNTLTSLQGYYHPKAKEAEFYKDVKLVNRQDGYILYTDTLFYNTATRIARIESLASIESKNDTIITRKAIYNTTTGNANLLTRSLIIHKDSTGNVTTLEGDSIVYNKGAHISRAFMFRDGRKHSQPMVLNDTAHKTTLIGGYGIFNDATQEAMATVYPLLIDYAEADTIFLRADTIITYVIPEWVSANTNVKNGHNGQPSRRTSARRARNVNMQQDKTDKDILDLSLPYIDYPILALNEKLEEDNPLSLNVTTKGRQPQQSESRTGYTELQASNNKPDTPERAISQNQTATTPIHEEDTGPKVKKEFHVALAYPYARVFKQDIQGIADTIVVVERDSMIYLFEKPVVWSGERQITGNRIDVHLQDSTADWARLPDYGLLAEHIEEDFYNQITGKDMFATFENQTLRRLEVEGNVETIFLPEESDSTFNRIVQAESSYLTLDMKDGKMDKLKMWPDVNGTVTPLFLLKRGQQFLLKFRWLEFLRPKRIWYGDRVVWDDELGEVPDELLQYFKEQSVFGPSKTTISSVVDLPKSTIKDYETNQSYGTIPDPMIKEEDISQMEAEMQQLENKAIEQSNDIEKAVEQEESQQDSPLQEETPVEEVNQSKEETPSEMVTSPVEETPVEETSSEEEVINPVEGETSDEEKPSEEVSIPIDDRQNETIIEEKTDLPPNIPTVNPKEKTKEKSTIRRRRNQQNREENNTTGISNSQGKGQNLTNEESYSEGSVTTNLPEGIEKQEVDIINSGQQNPEVIKTGNETVIEEEEEWINIVVEDE